MSWDPPVSRRLMDFLAAASAGTLAAFDADGTLWSRDVGEAFLKWAGETGKLKRWPKGDAAWTQYEMRIATGDLRYAFEFCLTAFADLPDEQVAVWAREFVHPKWDEYLYRPMRSLVSTLHQREAEVWIVSGSPAWCVVPGAALLGVPPERVIAGRPELSGGIVQDRIAGELPIHDSKVKALIAAAGRAPHLAAGNSEYDYPLLESARVLSLLINPATDSWTARKGGDAWLVQRWSS